MKPTMRITQAQVQLSTDRPVRVQPLAVERAVAPHDHDYHEISLLTAGQCVHRTKAGARTLSAGDVIVMPRGYHPNVAAPGGSINFLWMMAANEEVEDRQFGVVNVQPEYAQGGSGLEASQK